MTKPSLKIVENDQPDTEYKDGDGSGSGGDTPTNDASYGWHVPVALWVFGLVGLGGFLLAYSSIDDVAILMGVALLVSPVLPWVFRGGWAVAIGIWIVAFLAFA